MENLFSIHLWSKDRISYNGVRAYEGEIFIDKYKSTFIMPVGLWGLRDYKRQWKKGIERIKNNNKSCLITSVWGAGDSPMINMYVLYRIKDIIFIREHIVFGKLYQELSKGKVVFFTPETCYQFVRDMTPQSPIPEDRVWEEKINISDLP